MSASSFHRRVVALLRKETRQLLRDRSNLAVGLLLPVLLILLFGYGLSFDVTDAPIAIVLEDRSPQARDVLAGLQGSPFIAPVWTTDMSDGVGRMRAGEVRAVLRVPSDFTRQLALGQGRLQLLLNGVDTNTAATWARGGSDKSIARGEARPAPHESSSCRGCGSTKRRTARGISSRVCWLSC